MPRPDRAAAAPGLRPAEFYAAALSEAERAAFESALQVEGIEQEIALLRLRLREALKDHPEDVQLMFKGVELLAKAVATKYRLSKRAERDLAGAIANVIRGFGDLWPMEVTDAGDA